MSALANLENLLYSTAFTAFQAIGVLREVMAFEAALYYPFQRLQKAIEHIALWFELWLLCRVHWCCLNVAVEL